MTRKGKIARLPYETREALNRRILNGEEGVKLVEWLNSRPVVKGVLAEEFAGRPITEQNFSEWKQGGYLDWVRDQEGRDWVRSLVEESGGLAEEAGEHSVADWLSAPLAMALGRWLRTAAAGAQNDPAQCDALLAVARELTNLRRGDHEAKRLRLESERWGAEQEEIRVKKNSAAAMAPYWKLLLANQVTDMFKDELAKPGGNGSERLAEFVTILKQANAKAGDAGASPEPPTLAPNRGKSDQIQPNPTKTGEGGLGCRS